MKPFLLLFLLITTLQAQAQLTDDFTDGNFTDNPTWVGQTDRFAVTDGELQLSDAGNANTSYLALPAPTSTASLTTWTAYARLEFAPSTSNFARIYLTSSAADLTGSLTGYYLKIGGESGDTDDLEFYRQDGTTSTLLLSGAAGTLAADPAQVRIVATRTTDGEWTIEADYTGGEDVEPVGTVTDLTYPTGAYFGVWCRYTATRAESFFFDDIAIDPLFVDNIAPQVAMATAPAAQTVVVRFTEAVVPASLDNVGAYLRIEASSGAMPTVTTTVFDTQDPTLVILTLADPLQEGIDYTVAYAGIEDLAGNAAPASTFPFVFQNIVMPQPGDLVITEIMADPTPTAGLPEVEYVEIYNNSAATLQLGGVTISSGSTPQALASQLLAPGAYLLIVDEDNLDLFSSEINKTGVPTFPALTNGGDVVEIASATGTLLAQVDYDISWYGSPALADGGYSLELIRLSGPYNCAANWRASQAPAGGTPAAPNSVAGIVLETTGPQLLSAYSTTGTTVQLIFDEVLDPAVAADPSRYLFSNGITVTAATVTDMNRQVTLTVTPALQAGQTYQLTVAMQVADCLGNTNTAPLTATVAVVDLPTADDLIISEVMPQPAPQLVDTDLPNAEYVEIYNRSTVALLLRGVSINSGSTPRLLPDLVLAPGAYLILTNANQAAAFASYGQVVGIADFPTLTNGGDVVELRDAQGNSLVSINYDLSWYGDPTKAPGGYSLEIIDLDGPVDCSENWRASQAVSRGTPGQVNSVNGLPYPPGGPRLLRAYASSPTELILQFDQDLDAASAENTGFYMLDNGAAPLTARLLADGRRVRLSLTTALTERQVYTLTVAAGLANCVDIATTAAQPFRLGLPEAPVAGDIVINELLYYANTGGSDFVELYNRSDKIIDIAGLTIVEVDSGNGDSILVHYPLLPGEYVVITEDTADIAARYFVQQPLALLQNPLPTFPNDQGTVGLFTPGQTQLDLFRYSEDLHNALLNTDRGVSLERLDPDTPTNAAGNWQSAAGTVDYATPTYRNSQYLPAATPVAGQPLFSLQDDTFSPDSDGFQDVLVLNYQLERTGYIAEVRIFDAQGRPVRYLQRSELLGTDGRLLWDGTTDDGGLANIGIYLLYIETFTPDGATQREKLTAVLARK